MFLGGFKVVWWLSCHRFVERWWNAVVMRLRWFWYVVVVMGGGRGDDVVVVVVLLFNL